MSMTTNDFFAGSRSGDEDTPSFTFEKVGDGVVGDIVHVPTSPVETKYGPRLPIQLRRDDQSVVTLWIKQGQMGSAIHQAATATGAEGIAVGGRLAVVWESEKPSNKGNPMKVYSAKYKAPTVNLGDAFPGSAPATAADLL